MIDQAYIDTLQIHNTPTYAITKVKGLGSPPPRVDKHDRAQRHGVLNFTRWYSGRLIILDGIVIGSTLVAAWNAFDTLKGAAALGSTHVFQFHRVGRAQNEQCNVIVDSELDSTQDLPIPVIPWSLSLLADDPRMYSAALSSASYDPSLAGSGGGVAMPLVVIGGLVFSSTSISHLVATNNGQFSTPVTLTVKGPINNPIIDNETTVQSIALLYNLGVNDTVVVDTGNRTVVLNGASRPDLLDAANTQWWDIVKGTNSIRLRGSGMTTGNTLLTAQFRDANI